uniref:Lipase E, hormone sensitive type n=1 Tax=Monodelphis domestica TaxID=13616 RepID=H9H6M4_MONDO
MMEARLLMSPITTEEHGGARSQQGSASEQGSRSQQETSLESEPSTQGEPIHQQSSATEQTPMIAQLGPAPEQTPLTKLGQHGSEQTLLALLGPYAPEQTSPVQLGPCAPEQISLAQLGPASEQRPTFQVGFPTQPESASERGISLTTQQGHTFQRRSLMNLEFKFLQDPAPEPGSPQGPASEDGPPSQLKATTEVITPQPAAASESQPLEEQRPNLKTEPELAGHLGLKSKEDLTSEQRLVSEQNSPLQPRLDLKQEPTLQQEPIEQLGLWSKQESTSEQGPVSKQDSPKQQRLASGQDSPLQQPPPSQDSPLQHRPAAQQEITLQQQQTIAKQEAGSEKSPLAQQLHTNQFSLGLPHGIEKESNALDSRAKEEQPAVLESPSNQSYSSPHKATAKVEAIAGHDGKMHMNQGVRRENTASRLTHSMDLRSMTQSLVVLSEDNAAYFASQGPGDTARRLRTVFMGIREQALGLEPALGQLLGVAHLFDLDAETPANGYRSLVHTARCCLAHLLHKARYVASSRKSIFFRAGHNLAELEAYLAALTQLRALAYYAQRLLAANQPGGLFFEGDGGLSADFLREYGTLHKGCFYGRCLGFQVRATGGRGPWGPRVEAGRDRKGGLEGEVLGTTGRGSGGPAWGSFLHTFSPPFPEPPETIAASSGGFP